MVASATAAEPTSTPMVTATRAASTTAEGTAWASTAGPTETCTEALDRRSGRGHYEWTEVGLTFEGMFHDDRRTGRGSIVFPDGSR
ncbi:conserved unknown protein [Ectocarpus siliculosus]|uniref:Uncharacterized protein n=1 Tax=Ectocarpus siliculosus TaxID=2880 RepID=D7G7A2_ECTSI|nr:conserved unknown protein [Ectocarpus siliculosus]|eukprot:CBJ27653.1 conserved unknown protein [Ectocarpus siliculosus]